MNDAEYWRMIAEERQKEIEFLRGVVEKLLRQSSTTWTWYPYEQYKIIWNNEEKKYEVTNTTSSDEDKKFGLL